MADCAAAAQAHINDCLDAERPDPVPPPPLCPALAELLRREGVPASRALAASGLDAATVALLSAADLQQLGVRTLGQRLRLLAAARRTPSASS